MEVFSNPERVVVALSGGKASAYCAKWTLEKFDKDKVVLYFNDTKWEHKDLYRFLNDLSNYLQHPITEDSDGRTPEQLFHDRKALANDRMPFCSIHLKAERLQRYCKNGDLLIFGIGVDEPKRVVGIMKIYAELARKKKINLSVRFPLVEDNVSKQDVDTWLRSTGIEEPYLYKLGFTHNNCSGGCVRAGKKQYKRLLETLPEVYADRERIEKEFSNKLGKRVTFLKDESLEHLRGRIERGELSRYYYDDDNTPTECIGICNLEN